MARCMLTWMPETLRWHRKEVLMSAYISKLRHACSSLAYADDLETLTQNLSDMRVQAHKLTRYADWSQMKVNTGKTIISGILHATAKTKRYSTHAATDARVLAMQLENKIIVQGKPVTYQHPADPFTYLGVDLTLTLNWPGGTNYARY
jgi:hypothetical protein